MPSRWGSIQGGFKLEARQGRKEIFHTFVAKVSHLCEQHRLDAQPAMTVWSRVPGHNDWNELAQVMKFPHPTIDDVLTPSM